MSAPVDVVTIAGPDAESYLQGQLSQDVAALQPGDTAWTFVLAPTGKIDGFGEIIRRDAESFEFRVDAGFGEAVETRLRRFLLRTKAEIAVIAAASVPTADDEAARIQAGRPSLAFDIDERTVPAETGWVDRAVSFTKGCYTGQELVARMDSRVAEPPRRLVRVRSGAPLERDQVIEIDGAVVGAITSAATNDAGSIALGYVKRGTPTEGPATVGGVDAALEGPVGA